VSQQVTAYIADPTLDPAFSAAGRTVNRHALAAMLALAAGVTWFAGGSAPPAPAPAGPLTLVWVGTTADTDRRTMGTLCAALADAIEHDGTRSEPRIRSGTQVEELRTVAREGRTGGVSIGERQPEARRAIGEYLDREAGKSGGPLDAAARGRWVTAFRGVAQSCGVGR
jgi:hypothetical protein